MGLVGLSVMKGRKKGNFTDPHHHSNFFYCATTSWIGIFFLSSLIMSNNNQLTILRIKRKRTEEPLDALCK
jgi:hypothetical protein